MAVLRTRKIANSEKLTESLGRLESEAQKRTRIREVRQQTKLQPK